ncbi:tRNA pseudouridine(55) synthase TruB [Candidatus Uhrbacteria bacterium]|nr:tRNA pseudouridine(55) synthase TruB [Candidatus Uhrbacteria bacterium]
MTGFLLIDKPVGPTSHDIVDNVRRKTGEQRVGHAGTLDPFASGLLIVGIGREATREMQKLVGLDKTYEAVFVLGATSDTDDITGKIIPIPPSEPLTQERVQEAIKRFVGEIEQTPPAYSAIKIGGKKMYEAAREGKPIEAKKRKVRVYSVSNIVIARRNEMTTKQSPRTSEIASASGLAMTIKLSISCSSGTYIRAIARDLGVALGTGGYVESLRRTKIGPFDISECRDSIFPISAFLSRLYPVKNIASNVV